MNILRRSINDVTIEILALGLCNTKLTGARLYSTGLAALSPNFNRSPEWEAKPPF